jgi:energy-coupling factor transporter ATP-binding protein EcfA2
MKYEEEQGLLLATLRTNSGVRATSIGTMELTPSDVVILLMGPPGSGKTTFLEIAAGSKAVGRSGSEHYTTGISAFRLSVATQSSSSMVLVNTPAFNDTGKPDSEILQLISGWLNQTYQKGIKVSGLIYFHQISNSKVEGTPLRNWLTFEGICGQHFNKVVIATTMWGSVDDEVGGKRELDLQEFWRVDIARGWSMQRFLRDRTSAADVLAPILEHRTTQPLQLQREISDFHLSLKQTTAARILFLHSVALLRKSEQNHEKLVIALLDRSIDRQQLRDLEEKLKSLYFFMKHTKATVLDLQETSWERFQRSMLLIPGLGAIFRSLAKRPELSPTNVDGPVLMPRNEHNAT